MEAENSGVAGKYLMEVKHLDVHGGTKQNV